jgi:Fe-S-cluster containining protein
MRKGPPRRWMGRPFSFGRIKIVSEKSEIDQTNPEIECRRCGTCCQKGGPALHIADQSLVESGKIALKQLLTIRQGEPAYDNVSGTIAPAVTDIIKVNTCPNNFSQCVFYEPQRKQCRIYENRPIECQALNCRYTRKIERIYSTQRLTRRHLLSKVEGLWDLVRDHQERCDYGFIAELALRIRQGRKPEQARQQLLELIHYDEALRKTTVAHAGRTSEMLEFLFGRSLFFTVQMFQLKLSTTAQGQILVQTDPSRPQMCYRRHCI